jgi:PAS domain S-box-containing protein
MDNLSIGLLQLNDRRADRFTSDTIDFFEGLGAAIGVALGRQQAEDELRRSEDKYRRLFSTVFDAILVSDAETKKFVDVNEAAVMLYGYSKEEFLRLTQPDITAEPDKPAESTQQTLEGRPSSIALRYHRRKDGTIFPVEVSASAFSLGDRRLLCDVAHDITARTELEKELTKLAIQERRRLGQELHDGLGQDLTGLGYLSGLLHDELRSDGHPQAEMANRLADGIRSALSSVRAVAKGLVPVEVDAGGLMAALEQLVASTERRTGISCRFECDGQVTVEDNDAATELYRIAQEAMSNAVKHARARHIELELTCEKRDRICLCVRDDGVGLPPDLSRTEGIGLRIMQHRADLIGATLKIRRAEGGGTEIMCTAPTVVY